MDSMKNVYPFASSNQQWMDCYVQYKFLKAKILGLPSMRVISAPFLIKTIFFSKFREATPDFFR
jgi:hypothetical protein